MTQLEHAKVIYNVTKLHEKKPETFLNTLEAGKGEKGKCHVCGKPDLKWTTLGENKKEAEQKMKEKQVAKRE
jgi:hypothetical protein